MVFSMLRIMGFQCIHSYPIAPIVTTSGRSVYGVILRYLITLEKLQCMMIYDIPAILALAFPRATTPSNIISGLNVAGISL